MIRVISKRALSLALLLLVSFYLHGCSKAGSDAAETTSPPNLPTIAGSVTGLNDNSTVVLRTEDGATITMAANKAFTLPQDSTNKTTQLVVATQPVGQTCTVTIGENEVEGVIMDVLVVCVTNTYFIGGRVNGLVGELVLNNNGGDTLTLSTDGRFSFPTAMPHGSTYAATIQRQPIGQLCTLKEHTGNATSPVTNIIVECKNAYTTSGTISGLVSGGALALQDLNGEPVSFTSNGPFSFPANTSAQNFSVTIFTQSGGQVCTVANGVGTVNGPSNSQVAINCISNAYRISGNVKGLVGAVVLQNKGGDKLSLTTNGPFNFPKSVLHGDTYFISMLTQPSDQNCVIRNESGMAVSAVTNIDVSCINTYSVSGAVSGLNGSIVLQSPGLGSVERSSSGPFLLPTRVSGGTYSVSVASSPPNQVCRVENGDGTLTNTNATQVAIICLAKTYLIGGTVSGLTGKVELQNANGDRVVVTTNGEFNFPTPIPNGAFSTTITAQPDGQTCRLSSASGTVNNANNNQIVATCAVNFYSIGGNVTGLTGSGSVTLQINFAETLTATASSPFVFKTLIRHGSAFAVQVLNQPLGQNCSVAKNASALMITSITDVSVTCTAILYSIEGTISGLTGTLELHNNGENLVRITNGAFKFVKSVAYGSTYASTIIGQPTGQTCTLSNGTGVALANVTQITVNCVVNKYTIGGNITGLIGHTLLTNHNTDYLDQSTNGVFSFVTPVIHGGSYSVNVGTQPTGQVCTVFNSFGVALTDINNISIKCVSIPPKISLAVGIKQLQFSWTAMLGASYYKLMVNPDGSSGYSQVGSNISATSVNVDLAVHRFNWAKATYLVSACNSSGVCVDSSNTISTTNEAINAIGYFKSANVTASDLFGSSVVVSADGSTLAVSAPLEDSGTTGVNSVPNEAMSDSGAVYVFSNASGVWVQQAYLKPPNPNSGSHFGSSIALSTDGSTLAVGADGEDSSVSGPVPNGANPNSGAVYVFTRAQGVWTQQAYLKASNISNDDAFGYSVALSGDGNALAVGALYEASSSIGFNSTPNELAPGAGAVYVYARNASSWSAPTYIKAPNSEKGDGFGSSVALSTDGLTLAVGAPAEDGDASSTTAVPNELKLNSGAVYVFVKVSTYWQNNAYIKPTVANVADAFGTSVSLTNLGKMLAVGAVLEGNTTGSSTSGNGAAYVFTRGTSGGWGQNALLRAPAPGQGDYFGNSVALSADGFYLAIGAPGEDSSSLGINGSVNESAANSGAVYVYARTNSTWDLSPLVKAPNTGVNDAFGTSVSLSNDGSVLAVGAPMEDGAGPGISAGLSSNAQIDPGAAFLY